MPERLIFLAGIIAAFFAVILSRCIQLQAVDGAHYSQVTDQSRVISRTIPARRGRILDRNHQPIADTRTVYNASVVFTELELSGKARRQATFWRLDERRLGDLLADLTGRIRLPPGNSLGELVVRELTSHPAVAVRAGKPRGKGTVAIVAVARSAFDPRKAAAEGDDPEDAAQLAESDILMEDPAQALEQEIRLRWNQGAQVWDDQAWGTVTAAIDTDFSLEAGTAATVLDPFFPAFTPFLPDLAGKPQLRRLRLVLDEQRTQGLAALARSSEAEAKRLEETVDRALAQIRAARVPQPGPWFYAAASRAEEIAPRLPRGVTMGQMPVPVPGGRERVLLIQGDPPQAEGVYSQVTRRVAANLGIEPVELQALIEAHGKVQTAAQCEQEFRTHQLALDHERLDRLALGLTRTLTEFGKPTSRLEVDALLAKARQAADKEWAGTTRRDPIPLLRDIPPRFAVRFAGRDAEPPRELRKRYDDSASELPGLVISNDVGRAYPVADSCVHLLGTIGRDPASQEGQPVGRWGLEATYDTQLRGIPGSRITIRTAEGVDIREDPPVDGADLVTELDYEVQTTAEDSLEHAYELAQELGTSTDKMDKSRAVGRGRAGFCLIDCTTGGIISLASNPRFTYEQLATDYDRLVKDPAQPLIDHAAVPDQPPGSSFKILTALACLEYGVINPGAEIYCKGYMAMNKKGEKILRDHAPAGSYDLQTAIQLSSNVYFATIGAILGPQRLCNIADAVGLGRNNAIDVPHQRPGLLPRPESIGRTRPTEPHWTPNDTWRMSIGQFATASPLQCVAIAAAVANGGHIVRPYLVRPVDQPEVKDLHIKKEWLEDVRRGMERVTANEPHSTARLLVLQGKSEGIKVAAKTGTSEWGSRAMRERGAAPDHAWMIGYAPADNPTVAFACFVHSGTFGGQACTPIVKRVLETYFAKYGRDGH